MTTFNPSSSVLNLMSGFVAGSRVTLPERSNRLPCSLQINPVEVTTSGCWRWVHCIASVLKVLSFSFTSNRSYSRCFNLTTTYLLCRNFSRGTLIFPSVGVVLNISSPGLQPSSKEPTAPIVAREAHKPQPALINSLLSILIYFWNKIITYSFKRMSFVIP